mmetsp:Transcript_52322/g.136766  ORF Transcript_52322/g.136766 Transcript_52322/m.136766 type:complete len:122 (-) Transcript_52322:349-714(-)
MWPVTRCACRSSRAIHCTASPLWPSPRCVELSHERRLVGSVHRGRSAMKAFQCIDASDADVFFIVVALTFSCNGQIKSLLALNADVIGPEKIQVGAQLCLLLCSASSSSSTAYASTMPASR